MAERRLCAASAGLVAIVDDAGRDVPTRAMAALALGELACRIERRSGRTDGLSAAAIASLESATSADSPATLRQAAVRALGRAGATGAAPVLIALRSDADPIVRFLAAQAATRLTRSDQFDVVLRDAIVAGVLERSTTYRIVDDPEHAP